MKSLEVTYHLTERGANAHRLAESLLLEQTVEVPEAVARRYPFVRREMMGRLMGVADAPGGGTRLRLELPSVTAMTNAAQLLNVLFGNASLHAGVTLVDFSLPTALLKKLPGPRFGLGGLRALTGTAETPRPLTATALKPVGLSAEALAGLCHTFAENGLDLIKDDHYLADQPTSRFAERVRACQNAIEDAAEETGRRALYAPHLSGPPGALRRQAEVAQEAGAGAVLLAPMLLGLPVVAELVEKHLDVPVLAHPSFAGAGAAVAPAALYGKLFRLFGADAVIFAGYGGRFAMSEVECSAIAEALRRDWPPMRPAWPAPAGGMTVERVPELVDFYGADVVLLIGGSLLKASQEELPERTRAFAETVRQAAARLER